MTGAPAAPECMACGREAAAGRLNPAVLADGLVAPDPGSWLYDRQEETWGTRGMKRLDELPESERAVLQQLSLGPASVQVISDNTGQADSAVWFLLARLQEAAFVRSDWPGGGVARPPRIYSLSAAGQRTVEGN